MMIGYKKVVLLFALLVLISSQAKKSNIKSDVEKQATPQTKDDAKAEPVLTQQQKKQKLRQQQQQKKKQQLQEQKLKKKQQQQQRLKKKQQQQEQRRIQKEKQAEQQRQRQQKLEEEKLLRQKQQEEERLQRQRQAIPEPEPDIRQQVRQRQYATRDANKMNYQNIVSYTIKAEGVDSLYLQPQSDQQIKCELYIYWKQANIFISSQYKEGEQVRVIVYEDDQRIIYDNSFYMVNGFSFYALQGSSYEVRFLSMGKIPKLVSMTLNKMLQKTDDLAEIQSVNQAQRRVSHIRGQIQAFFSISERNHMIEQKLNQQVLLSTKLYMGYEVFEMFFVLIVCVLQTMFIHRILNKEVVV